MARDNSVSRRTALKLTGAAASAALVAGCGGGGGNGNGNGDGDDGIEISPDDQIRFRGEQSGWVGLEPSDIEDEENPTLLLEEGEEYDIGWTEGDGIGHNIELRNSDDEVVDEEYSTEVTEEPEEESFTFEATDEIADYVCQPHSSSMRGSIELQ